MLRGTKFKLVSSQLYWKKPTVLAARALKTKAKKNQIQTNIEKLRLNLTDWSNDWSKEPQTK